ncbi:alpha/beta hydrolase family protein [Caulobacter sp. RL271]|uniref:Prolyl oligopeptidase family serine peptidase n=1 Tax=Caulobacter segnis TaxID=88688 RepID=A0ABY4ZMQ5_9CAUL|nr:prolyl oligopeptidase family serine peptidase [Caulobacter segnis]USQ93945.1 prolyl oligopeptidase family serine peptidase [Caulobacter segnis]
MTIVLIDEAQVRIYSRASWLAVLSVGLALMTTLAAPRPALAAPPSARDFTRYAALSDVAMSPDGQHIAGLISTDGEERLLGVWKTAHPEQPPFVIASRHMRLMSVRFVKNDRLAVVVQQTITVGSYKGHLSQLYITDLKGENWNTALPKARTTTDDAELAQRTGVPMILSRLPADPRHILVMDTNGDGAGDVYRADVYSGGAELVERGSEKFDRLQADAKGQIRAKVQLDYEDGKAVYVQWIRNPKGDWEPHFRSFFKDRNLFGVVGFSDDPNIVYVAGTQPGADKSGIYLYDVTARKILEPAFEHKLFDADGVVQDASGQLMGFTYSGPNNGIYWIEPKLAGLDKGVRAALGLKTTPVAWTDPGTGQKARIGVADGADLSVASWSDDHSAIIVEKSGPREPGEFYLFTADGKLSLLGKARPWIKAEALGDTRLVQYAARDGLIIPAFLTTPPASAGPGPYPAIVLPHGGPWARDWLQWDFGGWTQYFASRGYAVLQPQFRGSEGWGRKLWTAGDSEWGQKMQDDKDDGAKWLIDQKIADPRRIAMFGYSYGGYSALAASIRPNGLYQCAVSGAGGSLADMKHVTAESRTMREYQRPFVGGLDAIKNAKDAKIPIFLYHGERDTNVDIKESRSFIAGLKAANKPYKWLEIKDMGHSYDTMTPAMLETQLVEIEKFFGSECKPGGL